MTLLLLIPTNALIHSLAERTDINAALPLGGALLLVELGEQFVHLYASPSPQPHQLCR